MLWRCPKEGFLSTSGATGPKGAISPGRQGRLQEEEGMGGLLVSKRRLPYEPLYGAAAPHSSPAWCRLWPHRL